MKDAIEMARRMSDEPDTTTKVTETDVGYRVEIKSTRGTGTRDQDTVRAEMRTEAEPSVEQIEDLETKVTVAMADRRNHNPVNRND